MGAGIKIPTLDELVQQYRLLRLVRGDRLVVVDPIGARYEWTAPHNGFFQVESATLIGGRWVIFLNEMRFGIRFAERRGTPFRIALVKTFWGEEPSRPNPERV